MRSIGSMLASTVLIAGVASADAPLKPNDANLACGRYGFYAEPSGFAGTSPDYKLMFRLSAGLVIRECRPDHTRGLAFHVGLTLTEVDPVHSSGVGGELAATYPLIERFRAGLHIGAETSGIRQLVTYGVRVQFAEGLWGGVDAARTFGSCLYCESSNEVFAGLGFEGRGLTAGIGAAVLASILIGIDVSKGFHL